MHRKNEERLLGRVERLLELEAEVEGAAEELAATTDSKSWRRQRRTALLRAAIRYGIAVQRYVRRPPTRKR
jgi:hypothetical protein